MTGPHHSIIWRFTSTGHGPHLLRQLQHADEHRGHDLRDRRVVLLDEGQELLGVEVLHDDRRAAHALHGHVEAQRSRVVQRRRRQVDVVAGEPEQARQQHHQAGRVAQRRVGRRHLDALGPAGRARRVQHVGGLAPVGQRLARLRGDGVLVAVVAGHGAVEHEPQLHAGRVRDDLGRLVGLVHRRDERLGLAVVDDVGQLARRQSR
jgi:hypothetical protein